MYWYITFLKSLKILEILGQKHTNAAWNFMLKIRGLFFNEHIFKNAHNMNIFLRKKNTHYIFLKNRANYIWSYFIMEGVHISCLLISNIYWKKNIYPPIGNKPTERILPLVYFHAHWSIHPNILYLSLHFIAWEK